MAQPLTDLSSQTPSASSTSAASATGSEPIPSEHQISLQDYVTCVLPVMVIVIFLWVIPCLSYKCPKRISSGFERKKYLYFPCVAVVTCAGIVYCLREVRGLSFNDVFFLFVRTISAIICYVDFVLRSVLILIVLMALWKFKDNVLLACGVDAPRHLLGDWRDWMTCWSMGRFEPVDLWIWKVTDLPSAKLMSENHVFCEVSMGYNQPIRTRVHNSAGKSCIVKEKLQFNFDSLDRSCSMTIKVMTQNVIGSTEIGKVTVSCMQVNQMIDRAGPENEMIPETQVMVTTAQTGVFGFSHFVALDLIPAGKIWVRFAQTGYLPDSTSLWATATA